MDTQTHPANHADMPAKSRVMFRKFYLGEWIARLQRSQVDVAEAVGIGKPYLSQLISGEKKNPSAALVLQLSEVLGVTVNDLYKPPPTAASVESLRAYSPGVLQQLINQPKAK